MSRFLFGAALLGAMALTGVLAGEAHAQFAPGPFSGGLPMAPQTANAAQGGVLALPPNVKNVVSIDAHNMLLAQVEDANGETSIVQMRVNHNYTGVSRDFWWRRCANRPVRSPGFANGMGNNSLGTLNITGAGGGNGFNAGTTNGGGFNGFNSGFIPNNLSPNTTVTGSGIFAPRAQMPRQQIRK